MPLGQAQGTFTPFAELVTDNSNSPGTTVLTTFTVPTIGSSFANLTLTPNSTVLLSANTAYWLILGATGTGTYTYRWEYTNTNDAKLPFYAATNDNGMTWQPSAGAPFLIQVNSAVPEPSSFVLGGLAGLIGLAVLVRRRMRGVRGVRPIAH